MLFKMKATTSPIVWLTLWRGQMMCLLLSYMFTYKSAYIKIWNDSYACMETRKSKIIIVACLKHNREMFSYGCKASRKPKFSHYQIYIYPDALTLRCHGETKAMWLQNRALRVTGSVSVCAWARAALQAYVSASLCLCMRASFTSSKRSMYLIVGCTAPAFQL